jgi:hypothetical protein
MTSDPFTPQDSFKLRTKDAPVCPRDSDTHLKPRKESRPSMHARLGCPSSHRVMTIIWGILIGLVLFLFKNMMRCDSLAGLCTWWCASLIHSQSSPLPSLLTRFWVHRPVQEVLDCKCTYSDADLVSKCVGKWVDKHCTHSRHACRIG